MIYQVKATVEVLFNVYDAGNDYVALEEKCINAIEESMHDGFKIDATFEDLSVAVTEIEAE